MLGRDRKTTKDFNVRIYAVLFPKPAQGRPAQTGKPVHTKGKPVQTKGRPVQTTTTLLPKRPPTRTPPVPAPKEEDAEDASVFGSDREGDDVPEDDGHVDWEDSDSVIRNDAPRDGPHPSVLNLKPHRAADLYPSEMTDEIQLSLANEAESIRRAGPMAGKIRQCRDHTAYLAADRAWACCNCGSGNSRWEFLCWHCQAHSKGRCCEALLEED